MPVYKLLTLIFIVVLMGVLKFLFGKSNTGNVEKPTKSQNEYKENWDFYFSNVDDKYSSIAVDLGLHKIAPIKDKPNLVWISITFNKSNDNGFPNKEERDNLENIENALIDKIKLNFNSVYVGRLTSDGNRDFYFYFSDTTSYGKIIAKTMSAFPDYKYDFGSKEDKKWDGYFDFLYPLPQQLQSIENRKVIELLKEGGDALTKERKVHHWIYFKSEKDIDYFLSKAKEQGFKLESKEQNKSFGEFPYKLHISRLDKVDWDSVDEYVTFLWELAKENKGDYDGWETSIEKQ